MNLPILPDVEKLLVDYLTNLTEVTDLVDERISTMLDQQRPTVRIQRIGGFEAVRDHLDAPRIQIEAWADEPDDAWTIIATVRAAVSQLATVTHAEGVVTGIRTLTTPSWQPDPVNGTPRYLYDVQIYAHPHPASAGS